MQWLHSVVSYVAVSAMLLCGAAFAQGAADYPSRPVTMIVPLSPGATVDIETRLYAHKLTESMGRSFLVDYKPGAGTTIGAAYVAKAAPDGYTLLMNTPSFTVAPLVYPKLPYDSTRDLAPITLMSKRPSLFLVRNSLPFKTMTDYLDYARRNPGKLNFGTAGAGGIGHLAIELLHTITHSKVTFVHYKGGAPSYVAIMSGEIDAVLGGPSAMLPHVRTGKARALAVTSLERARMLSEVPTIAETVPGFEYAQWIGILAPAGTPAAVINKLHPELVKATRAPDIIQKLESDGTQMIGNTPEQFRQYMAAESARWKKIVQESGIKPAN